MRTDRMMYPLKHSLIAVAAVIMGMLPARADAISCEHFKTALVASASAHGLQTSVVPPKQVSPGVVSTMISFDGLSQPAALFCRYGYVAWFAADTKELNSSETLVMDIALTAWGFGPEEAAKIRELLITEAEQSHMAKVTAKQTKISLVISFAGAPSFQMDANW